MKNKSTLGSLVAIVICTGIANAQNIEKRAVAKLTTQEAQAFAGNGRAPGVQVASEDGRHVALLRTTGGSMWLEHDGKTSKKWEEIGAFALKPDGNSGVDKLRLSPDGSRAAYVAREGQSIFLIVGDQSTPIEPSAIGNSGWFSFSPDGSRYLMVVENGNAINWVVLDGKKLGPYGDVKHVTFSGDGKHVAFVALDSYEYNKRAGMKVVFDGKESPGYATASDLRMSHDGSRFAYVSQALFKDQPEGVRVVVDGKPSPQPYAFVKSLQISPNGKRVAFIGAPTLDGVGFGEQRVYLDGKPGKTYQTIQELKLSPDGSRWAARVNIPIAGHDVMRATYVIDGKETRSLDEVGMAETIFWTSDSKRVAIEGLTSLLENGTENPAEDSAQGHGVRVGPNGSYAYQTKADDNIVRMFVNGKKGPDLTMAEADSLVFSPDGKDVAYWGTDLSGKFMLITNGKTYPGVGRPDGFLITKSKERIKGLWSPDGKHYATIVQRNLIVDGRVAGDCLHGFNPAFSPDSNHFAVACQVNSARKQEFAISLNGQHVVKTEAVFLEPRNTVRFGADNVLETYALIDTDLTALRITPDKGGIAQIGSGPGAAKSASTASEPTQTTVAGQTVPVPETPNAAEKATEKAKDALKKLPGLFKKKKNE
ncbi:MAG TPA: hypothetical protein VFS58_13790 [Steroidobacteraceae bacterium]|nr:hypothetical protein [Steroidobacteraceae bacterium]